MIIKPLSYIKKISQVMVVISLIFFIVLSYVNNFKVKKLIEVLDDSHMNVQTQKQIIDKQRSVEFQSFQIENNLHRQLKYLEVKNIDGNTISSNVLFESKTPYLIYFLSEESCSACYDEELERLKKLTDVFPLSIVLFVDSNSLRFLSNC